MNDKKEIEKLKVENEKLLLDKNRLDWLADMDNKIGNVTLPIKVVENNLHSLRDAIDEAMKFSGEK